MTWQATPELSDLIRRIAGRHRETLSQEAAKERSKIVTDFAARNMHGSGMMTAAIADAYNKAFRTYCYDVIEDVLPLVVTDGSIAPEAAEWVRGTLVELFRKIAAGVTSSVTEGKSTPQLRAMVEERIKRTVNEAKLDLGIKLDSIAVRSAAVNSRTPVVDDSLKDTLAPTLNRRALETDVRRLLEGKTTEEPLAVLFFDLDNFKKVNDESKGKHKTGDQAIIAVATIANNAARGKGTVYRLGGDEFVVILPNHGRNEAIAVAERIRTTVNDRPLTDESLTLAVSIGIAVAPEHGQNFESLKESADRALYDAKDLGRNLVRVFGEVGTVEPRIVERREPEGTGLRVSQREKIRLDYFRTGMARCPNDDAILEVQDTTSMGQTRNSIYVSCPQCGLSEELD